MASSNTLADYRRDLHRLRFGKRVGPYLYIHKVGATELVGSPKAFIQLAIDIAESERVTFNVIKLSTRQLLVSFLHYPEFDTAAFPLLETSAKLDEDHSSLKVTSYKQRENRPVLHRKELLLPPDHHDYVRFAEITRRAESLGLLRDQKKIGLSLYWNKTLEAAGVTVTGNQLSMPGLETNTDDDDARIEISRHKSAMRRKNLSLPLQAIQRYGYLNGDHTLFDYGCGRGDDLEELRALSLNAAGWDPYYRNDQKKSPADIVNLGYVINVIESPEERRDALAESYSLARKFLVVSALIGNPSYSGNIREHADGLVTSIGTFQKYFLPDELENYIRQVLQCPVVSIAQGIVLAFKSQGETDRFMARRAGARIARPMGSVRRAAELFSLDHDARDLLKAFWNTCVSLGREPLESEVPNADALKKTELSIHAAYNFLRSKFGEAELLESGSHRRDEMLVQFALGQFDGRVYFKYLPDDVKRDVESFFGTFTELNESAKALLYSVSNTDQLCEAANAASSDELGYFLGEDAFQFHVDSLDSLPIILRVYVGCAGRLLGGYGRADLIKSHLKSGKVSFMTYDDFEGQPVPSMIERIKVSLWSGKIDYFDYIAGYVPPPLLMKSLFMPKDSEHLAEQEKFDRQIMKAGLYDAANPHPSKSHFECQLKNAGLKIRGFELVAN